MKMQSHGSCNLHRTVHAMAWMMKRKRMCFFFHLQDHARIWYNSLSYSIRNNWQSLEAAFKKRFTEDRDTLDLSILQISQSVAETVLDYLCRLQKNDALNPKVDDNLLLAIAVNS